MTDTLALIPARGGSKRLPRKNILDFLGRPMLAWTVKAALDAAVFDRVTVSTEDPEIAEIALESGAEVLDRPADVADDSATLVDVAHHALDHWGTDFSALCLLLPNCPLRNEHDIQGSWARFNAEQPVALLSVVPYGWTPPFRALRQSETGLEALMGDWVARKSQTYPDVVCPSGAIYWTRPGMIARATSLYATGIQGFRMPWHRGIDIDTSEDFELAQCIATSVANGFEFSS